MNRRQFILNGMACAFVAIAPFPVISMLPTLAEGDTVDIDWLHMAALKGDPYTKAEVRYRVNLGEWKNKIFAVQNRSDGLCIVKMFENVELQIQTRSCS